VLAVLMAAAAVPVLAEPPAQSELVARDAWVRQPPPGAQVGAAYLTLSNIGHRQLTVTGFDSPVAAAAMLHVTQLESGQSRMRPQAALALAAGETVVLKPGGLHVMLHGLKQPLVPGQHIPLVVSLADGRTLTVSALVRPIGSE
jgi:copper(I)-binding protein